MLKRTIFWVILIIVSFFFVPSNWIGGVAAQLSRNAVIDLFVYSIPLFALAYMAARVCRLLKQNIFVCFLTMALCNSSFFLIISDFRARGIIAAILSSCLIFASFVAEEIIQYALKDRKRVDTIINIIFSLLSFSCICYIPFAGIKIANNFDTAKKRAVEEELSKKKVYDADVAPYFKAAMSELSKHYQFKNFPSIFKDVKDCCLESEREGEISLNFYHSSFSASFTFKKGEPQSIVRSNIYFNNSGRLRDIGNNESESINANFSRKAEEKMKPTARIVIYSKSSAKMSAPIEIEGDEVIKKTLLAEAYMQKLEEEYRNRQNSIRVKSNLLQRYN